MPKTPLRWQGALEAAVVLLLSPRAQSPALWSCRVSASLQGALVQWLDGAADRRGAEAGWGKNFAAECRGVVAVMPTRS